MRGLLLVIMAAVHVPTPLSEALREPFGLNSAAEGFFLVGGCLAGFVYGKTYRQAGWSAMLRQALRRARAVYAVHLALIIPIALLACVLANRLVPITNHFHDLLFDPPRSILLMPVLLHQPPLFDILPMYVILLALTPWLMALAHRQGWRMVLLLSLLVWSLGQWTTGPADSGGKWLPLRWGPFDLLAWQLLWVGGLATGSMQVWRRLRDRDVLASLAGLLVLSGLVLRHGGWPWLSELAPWMDKWSLGPLRVLNLTAWTILLLYWQPRPSAALIEPLALLGRHSLAVFALHIPLVIAATTLIQIGALPDMPQTLIGLLVIALLFLLANGLEAHATLAIGRSAGLPLASASATPFQSGFTSFAAGARTARETQRVM